MLRKKVNSVLELAVVAHTNNPSTQEVEVGGVLILGTASLHNQILNKKKMCRLIERHPKKLQCVDL